MEEQTRQKNYPKFNLNNDFEDPQFRISITSPIVDGFKETVKEYAIKSQTAIRFKGNESKWVKVIWKEGCS